MIRILIVEDIPLYRAGLRSVLEHSGDCIIVGCATQATDILHLVQAEHPDVVLLHEGLGTGDALEIAGLLLQQAQQRGIFVLADSGTEEQVFQFFLAGAAAYESRWITSGDLVEKVRRVSTGEYLISDASISPNQGEEMRPRREPVAEGQRHTKSSPAPGECPLSSREIQILERVAQGMGNKEIASDLSISDQTVKNHITSLMRKLGVLDRTAAVMYALRWKWIALEEPVRRGRALPV